VLAAPQTSPAGLELTNWVRPRVSPRGDQLLFGRQSNMQTGRYDTTASRLWVVGSDGTGARRVGTPMEVIKSAVWDPSQRFIAYTGLADSVTSALRVVDVATGVVHEFQLPNPRADVRVSDWSADGRYLAIVALETRGEFWVVEGLQGDRP
jgi:dipeptidyl aminopeptidase/acylaminoacyl peptidase